MQGGRQYKLECAANTIFLHDFLRTVFQNSILLPDQLIEQVLLPFLCDNERKTRVYQQDIPG